MTSANREASYNLSQMLVSNCVPRGNVDVSSVPVLDLLFTTLQRDGEIWRNEGSVKRSDYDGRRTAWMSNRLQADYDDDNHYGASGKIESRLEQIRCGSPIRCLSPTNTYGSTRTHLLPEDVLRPTITPGNTNQMIVQSAFSHLRRRQTRLGRPSSEHTSVNYSSKHNLCTTPLWAPLS